MEFVHSSFIDFFRLGRCCATRVVCVVRECYEDAVFLCFLRLEACATSASRVCSGHTVQLSVSMSCARRGGDWMKITLPSVQVYVWVFRTWGRPPFGGGCVRGLDIMINCAPQEKETGFELCS